MKDGAERNNDIFIVSRHELSSSHHIRPSLSERCREWSILCPFSPHLICCLSSNSLGSVLMTGTRMAGSLTPILLKNRSSRCSCARRKCWEVRLLSKTRRTWIFFFFFFYLKKVFVCAWARRKNFIRQHFYKHSFHKVLNHFNGYLQMRLVLKFSIWYET